MPLAATEVLTCEARLSFPSLFTATSRFKGDPNAKLAFQTALLFPPNADLKPLLAAMKAAMLKKFGKEIVIPAAKHPIKDAGEKDYAGYQPGWKFIHAHSDRQPAVVSRNKVPITDESMVYPGMWVKAYLNAFAWSNTGGKGVSFGLNAIQVVRDGERLDGRKSADEVFEALEDDGSDLIG